MDKIIDSNVILETNITLNRTFEDLQKLKEMGIADYKSRILHNDGELLPAGAYNDYDAFVQDYHMMSSVEYGDTESLSNAKNFLMDAYANMTEKERQYALIGWEDFLHKKFDRLNKEVKTQKR